MPTDPPTDDLLALCDRLESLAKEATPGPYHVKEVHDPGSPADMWWVSDDCDRDLTDAMDCNQAKANVERFALLDPATVSTLTAAVRRLIGERDAARSELNLWRASHGVAAGPEGQHV